MRRINSPIRDFIFPFYTASQFYWLAGFCLAVFFLFHLNSKDGWEYAAVAWISGSLVLTSNAPGDLVVSSEKAKQLRDLLVTMRFIPQKDEAIWYYDFPAWLKWSNSKISVARKDSELQIIGPISTLSYIGMQLSRS